MESRRVDMGTHARTGRFVCIFGACLLGRLAQHALHSALCLYSASIGAARAELVFAAHFAPNWSPWPGAGSSVLSFRGGDQYHCWSVISKIKKVPQIK